MQLLDRFRRRGDTHTVSHEPKLAVTPAVIPRYTNGFETIYALENVDLATVRPMSKPQAPVTTRVRAVASKRLEERDPELDLGAPYRGWMESFRLDEPIEVLGLSPMALKALVVQERLTIRDLVDPQTESVIALSGMGQGHIEEIHEKLAAYLGDRPLFRCQWVDYLGLLRGLLTGINPKNAYLCLERYGLESLFALNAAQKVEVRHLNEQNRADAIGQARGEMLSESRQKRLRAALKEMSEVFLKPWVRGRLGLASQGELTERAEAVGEDPVVARQVLRAIGELFFDGQFLFHTNMIEVEPGLYCADYRVKKRCQALGQRLQTYFYRRGLSYGFDELVGLICREQAVRWDVESPEFIEAYLRMSSAYRLRKAAAGKLVVRRA